MTLDPGRADALVARHPLHERRTARGVVSFRAAGAGPPLVLLHGIGSGSGAWTLQLDALGARHRVIAWDAPGYGDSEPLPAAAPAAADYATTLAALWDTLEIDRAVVVASSLGALMAGAFAAGWPARLAGLVLLSPAGGYGRASPAEREAKLAARLERLAALGPGGMAQELPAGMLSAAASPDARALAAWSTARLRPDGYAQAARMLAGGSLADDATRYDGPVLVVAASADTITPPARCAAIAAAFPRGEYRLLDGPGHLSYLEAPDAVNALVGRFASACLKAAAL
ncbi:MAG: alpha/beta fold hydrolase [Burkholderiales bacterium]|nr:alpha/beta fold hydrolase [Burkholderiales bacterium]